MNWNFRRTLACLATVGLSAGFAATALAKDADFFADKQIQVLIGNSAGTSYDLYARVMTDNIGRFIPGHPTFVPRDTPGAGGLRVMNHLYEAAARDGTVWGTINRNVATETLLFPDTTKAVFKSPLEFNWIGSLNTEVGVAAVWHTTGITSWKDTLTRPTIVAMASSQGGAGARVLNAILGTKFEQVCCYGGDANQNLAMERGEVEGRVGWSWSSLRATKMDWLKSGKIRILMQVGLQKDREIPGDVPLVLDLVKSEKDKQALKVIFGDESIGRPVFMPPKVPADRVAIIQRAFMEMVKDPQFLAAAEKRHLEVNDPKSGEEVESLLKEIYGSPKDVVAVAQKALEKGEYKVRPGGNTSGGKKK
jgi:tripartite-type tricarboxylate transporter receptor subunit TctC